jgi:DNA-binding PadR family transcriptional regulator
MHGYEMFQQFEEGTLGKIVRLEMSQMYAFLKKLERLKYIESHLEMQGTRPPRKIFHLTELGYDLFLHWLTQPVEKPRDIRILFLIKLYFIQQFLPHKIASLIEQEILTCQHFLEHLESKQGSSPGDTDFFDHVVLRSRIHQTRALLDWMQELQTELAGTPS